MSPEPPDDHGPVRIARLSEVASLFLYLGLTAFGGPAAHIALMEQEVVRRREWLSRDAFLDLLGTANLLPGPSSTELAILVGQRRAGGAGLVVAGLCFLLPATFLVTLIAWAYARYGHLPAVSGMLYGAKPVIVAVLLQALWSLGRTAVKGRALALVGGAAVAAALLGLHPLVALFGAGAAATIVRAIGARERTAGRDLVGPLAIGAVLLGTPILVATRAAALGTFRSPGNSALFLAFLKIGSVLYGSGYVLLAFLRADLMLRCSWLTPAQLLDATAVGQITPGPLFTTATFIGYILHGIPGAIAATVGIFLPAFVFVALAGPLTGRLRRSPLGGAFLDGVNVGAVALMAVVSAQLARSAIVDGWTAGLAAIGAVLLIRMRMPAAWLVPAGALLGALAGWIGFGHP